MAATLTSLSHPIQPGDKYIRNGNPPTTWVVDRVMEFNNHPPHVRLTKVNSMRTITFALSALADKHQFQRLDDGQ